MRAARPLVAAAAILAASGCMTLDTQFDKGYDGPHVYSGVRKDLAMIGPGFLSLQMGWVLFWTFDLPFSFVADTLLLPVTIPREAMRSEKRGEELQVQTNRPAPTHVVAGEAPADAAKRLFEACRDKLRRQQEAFADCYAVDARVTAGGTAFTGADYKPLVREALDRDRGSGVFVDWRDPTYAVEGERVRIHALRRSTGEPRESELVLVVAAGSDGGWRIVEETSVGFPEP
jgi:uncharacterized protein YceK